MKLNRLEISSFRNLSSLILEPGDNLNFISGNNGQGKTSILEAIGYLSTLRSFRCAKSNEVIHKNSETGVKETFSKIKGIISLPEDPTWKAELGVEFVIPSLADPSSSQSLAKKTATVNGKKYSSSSTYLSKRFGTSAVAFHSIIFNPSDHYLVRGEPSLRRTFLDGVCAAEDPAHYAHVLRYKKTLDQKNALLRQAKEKGITPSARQILQILNLQLAQEGAKVAEKRINWIKRSALVLSEKVSKIAKNQQTTRLVFRSSWLQKTEHNYSKNKHLDYIEFSLQSAPPSLELLEQLIAQKLSSSEENEWRSGHSLAGPHRDDWLFLLGDHFLTEMGSQGEVRASLLALKLTELELFWKSTGHLPIFLLDDFSSELDRTRREQLLSELTEKKLQVFVTSTEETFLEGRRFRINNGSIQEIHGRQSPGLERLFSG